VSIKEIQDQLVLQQNRLLTALENKERLYQGLEETEKEIAESRMGINTLRFVLDKLTKKKSPGDPPQKGPKG